MCNILYWIGIFSTSCHWKVFGRTKSVYSFCTYKIKSATKQPRPIQRNIPKFLFFSSVFPFPLIHFFHIFFTFSSVHWWELNLSPQRNGYYEKRALSWLHFCVHMHFVLDWVIHFMKHFKNVYKFVFFPGTALFIGNPFSHQFSLMCFCCVCMCLPLMCCIYGNRLKTIQIIEAFRISFWCNGKLMWQCCVNECCE